MRGFLKRSSRGRHGRSSGRCQLPSLIIMPMSMDFSSTHWPSQGAPGLSPVIQRFGVDIDLDLVTAGGALHDIGKIDSYKMDPFPSMTVPGTVIDHIALGFNASPFGQGVRSGR